MEYIERNLLSKVGTFKDVSAIKKEMDYYTADEFLKFISAAQKAAELSEQKSGNIYEWNFYIFFMIAFYTGMRKGEIYALKWTDIDGSVIRITRSIAQKLKGDDRETPPKSKSSVRAIQIPEPLSKALKNHLERYERIEGFTSDWRICGGRQCVRDSTLNNRNKQYAELAGIKKNTDA